MEVKMKRLVINTLNKKAKIHKEIYGHFSEHLGRCIYEGLYVGEKSDIPNTNGMRNDVVKALKDINIPVLRWPGGCFADEYHWKDGIGPKESRKKMINTHWGGVTEDNSFGTHEFMELVGQLGCEAYINMNVGSGSVQEMSEWVEYLTFNGLSPMDALREKNGRKDPWDVKFIGVGNENWGCGGMMNPEHYANEYRRYATFCRNYTDKKLFKILCGPNVDDYNWTEGIMKTIAPILPVSGTDLVAGVSLHYYTHPGGWDNKGKALTFTKEEYYETISRTYYMEELIRRHSDIINRYDPDHTLGLIVDEWGTWYQVEEGTNPGFLYQQNTIRDAMVAGINLDIFNRHADRVRMANIAQMINVLQAVILTDGEKMIKTPTYHVFDLYKDHMDADLLESYLENEELSIEAHNVNPKTAPGGVSPEAWKFPKLSHSVSMSSDGSITVTIVNASDEDAESVKIIPVEYEIKDVAGRIVTGEVDAHNDFDDPDKVAVKEFTAFKTEGNTVIADLPKLSVVCLKIR